MADDDYNYCVFDRALRSEIALPSLPAIPVDSIEDRVSLAFRLERKSDRDEEEFVHEYLDREGETTLVVYRLRAGEGYRLYLPDGGSYIVSADLSEITCIPDPGVAMDTIEHLLLDQVVPRMLAQSGELVFHGCSLRLEDGRVVGLIGDSGAGKSTLAATLYRQGGVLLTDDCFVVQMIDGLPRVIPGYAGIRLWPDMAEELFPDAEKSVMAHYSEKQRITLQSMGETTEEVIEPLSNLYLLSDTALGNDSAPVSDAIISLLSATFALDIRDPACHQIWLKKLELLLKAGVSFEPLRYEHSDKGLADVVERVTRL